MTNQQLNNHEETCICNACLPFDMEEREQIDYTLEWSTLDVTITR